MQQPDPKVKQKEIPCLHDSLVYFEQAESYRRASTKNQTANKDLQAARSHRPGAPGQLHHTDYRESEGLPPSQWRWEHQIRTPTGSKNIPNLSPRRTEGCQYKCLQTESRKVKTTGKVLSFLEAFHPQMPGLVDSRPFDQTQGQTSGSEMCLAWKNISEHCKNAPIPTPTLSPLHW